MKDLTQIDENTVVKIEKIVGGIGVVRKLDALGIREGLKIEKLTPKHFKGPVVIRLGNTQFAIGYGIAKKILVEEI